jgi:Ubiquitin carboxyl-terminal hydrolase
MIGAFCRHFTDLTYAIPFLNFSMPFVCCGTIASNISLHQGTPLPTHFSASTSPESYPSCDNQDHRTDSTSSNSHAVPISTQPHHSPNASPLQPAYGSSDALRLAEEPNVITGTPLHDMITREMRRSSVSSPTISPALPVHSKSYSPDSTKEQDVAAPSASQNLSTAPTSSPVPASTGQIPNPPFGSYDAGPASTPTLPLPASPDIPASPSHTPRLPDPELLTLLSGTSLSGPRDSATLSRLRARGLMSQGNMYFTNAVLQLLVHCPPFRNLFSDLGRLTGQTGQRGQGEGQQTSSGTTPLVDATVRLLDDFAYKKEDDGTEPFTPMYVYDAMKEKRQFKSMLVRSCAQVALSCY